MVTPFRAANHRFTTETAETGQDLRGAPQDRRGHVQFRVLGLAAAARRAAQRRQTLVRHQALGAHRTPRPDRT